jgi:hypothetical protein
MNVTQTPVLIYAPDLGHSSTNSADNLADVIAAIVDNQHASVSYSPKLDATVTAPRGLKVSKTLVDQDGNKVLQIFELDYKARFEGEAGPLGMSAPMGAIESTRYALLGLLRFVTAARRTAKSGMAKLQILLGLLPVIALIAAWLVAVSALLASLNLDAPAWLESVWGKVGATAVALGLIALWGRWRKGTLALALLTQRMLDYATNTGGNRDSLARTLDDALGGIIDDDQWGRIHLLGFSFGSLILIDALYPDVDALSNPAPADHVSSLTTIGCPADAVRLYFPEYDAGMRTARRPDLPWVNVFNATDVFGSNFRDQDDISTSQNDAPAQGTLAARVSESRRYGQDALTFGQLLRLQGFVAHAKYWSGPRDASCLANVAPGWVNLQMQ